MGEKTPAGPGGVRAPEIETRLASVKVGMWRSLIVCLASALSALETWGRPNRPLILVFIGLGLLRAPLVQALPRERIVRRPYRDLFFTGWSIADLLLIATIAALDGGLESAYM